MVRQRIANPSSPGSTPGAASRNLAIGHIVRFCVHPKFSPYTPKRSILTRYHLSEANPDWLPCMIQEAVGLYSHVRVP